MALIPGCQVEVVPGVGHLLGMQRPDLVNARLGTFLQSR
jgi:pimeloyl-ACP methyl ester carboxylesterase